MKNNFFYIFFLILVSPLFSQESDSLVVKKDEKSLIVKESIVSVPEYDPLAPSRVAFYSAVVPGLGQAYNKKYWKIPIIYAGMAAGVYFYKQNDKDYNRFRDAYKRRLAGYKDDEFFGDGNEPVITNDRLINAQRSAQKNKSISIIVTLAFYLLNIVDANVDAHLQQYEVMDDLSLQPNFEANPFNSQPHYGMSLVYRFK